MQQQKLRRALAEEQQAEERQAEEPAESGAAQAAADAQPAAAGEPAGPGDEKLARLDTAPENPHRDSEEIPEDER
jgi:hypothetical protein